MPEGGAFSAHFWLFSFCYVVTILGVIPMHSKILRDMTTEPGGDLTVKASASTEIKSQIPAIEVDAVLQYSEFKDTLEGEMPALRALTNDSEAQKIAIGISHELRVDREVVPSLAEIHSLRDILPDLSKSGDTEGNVSTFLVNALVAHTNQCEKYGGEDRAQPTLVDLVKHVGDMQSAGMIDNLPGVHSSDISRSDALLEYFEKSPLEHISPTSAKSKAQTEPEPAASPDVPTQVEKVDISAQPENFEQALAILGDIPEQVRAATGLTKTRAATAMVQHNLGEREMGDLARLAGYDVPAERVLALMDHQMEPGRALSIADTAVALAEETNNPISIVQLVDVDNMAPEEAQKAVMGEKALDAFLLEKVAAQFGFDFNDPDFAEDLSEFINSCNEELNPKGRFSIRYVAEKMIELSEERGTKTPGGFKEIIQQD